MAASMCCTGWERAEQVSAELLARRPIRPPGLAGVVRRAVQLIAQLAGDPSAQHPHGHAAQRCGAAAVESEVTQRLADGLLQDEQGPRSLDPEDERLGLMSGISASQLPWLNCHASQSQLPAV